ncbi:MAG: type III pantothenate kinase [Oscillospiraceae bacterium]|jgi:type III pantothenate kinase|nr:type III pantothenate kinase [Oscillospiraceae bacterium]
MILTMDVGNTNIKTGVFDGERLAAYWRISTSRTGTSDELGILLNSLFANKNLSMNDIDGVIYSSVVPTVNFTIEHMCRGYFNREPFQVSTDLELGIDIRYEHPHELGTDRIANAVAAYSIYGGPCVFIDFGTATTFGVVTAEGAFLGGAICPGIKLSAEALVSGAAKLPRVELNKPDNVIGRNTVENIQAGLVYGFVGQIDYIVRRMKAELGDNTVRVVATGGLATLIASESRVIDVLDGLLTLKGLRILYERNAG